MKTTTMKILALVVPPVAIFGGDIFATTDMSVGEISDMYFGEVLIIPAGYAFSIWGLIYLGVLALAVVQALPGYGDNPHFEEARIPLIANMACNFAWVATWQSLLFPIATVILVLQLATGVWLYYALGIPSRPAHSTLEEWIRFPISVYVGWLTLATVVGVSTLFHFWEWGAWGLSYAAWASIMLAISAVIGFVLTLRWEDPVYGLVFIWGYAAVALRPDQVGVVIATAVVLGVLFAVVIVVQLWMRLRKREVQPAVVG